MHALLSFPFSINAHSWPVITYKSFGFLDEHEESAIISPKYSMVTNWYAVSCTMQFTRVYKPENTACISLSFLLWNFRKHRNRPSRWALKRKKEIVKEQLEWEHETLSYPSTPLEPEVVSQCFPFLSFLGAPPIPFSLRIFFANNVHIQMMRK
jgi:hypothetical protein